MVAQERHRASYADARGLARYQLPAYRPLRERGISPHTLAAFGVSSGRWRGEEGWLYPVYGPGRALLGVRFKSAQHAPRYKYGWVECDTGASGVLYGAGCIRTGAPAVLCAGEPDCWLLHSLDIPGCTSLRGEGAHLSPEAVAGLAARAPSIVLVAYDADDAGRRGAAQAARALRDAGLRARAVALPADVGEHGDLCDLYAQRSRARQSFLAALAGCADLAVPRPNGTALHARGSSQSWAGKRSAAVPRPQAGERAAASDARRSWPQPERAGGPWQEFNARHDLRELVEGVVRLRRRGIAYVGLCPFHHESTPSFHVYCDHYYCYGCQRWGSAWDFDRWLKGESESMS